MSFTFKVWESIKKAWVLYKENFGQIMILALVMLAIQILSQSNAKHSSSLIISLIIIIISIFLSYLWIKSSLSLIDGKGFDPFAKESLPNLRQIWDFFKTNILVVLCIIPLVIPFFILIAVVAILFAKGGATQLSVMVPILMFIMIPISILVIIPAVYISSRLFPAKYLSVEKCQGARKSVSEAWNITKGNGWRITWKVILIGLFTISGIIALGFGLLITYPLGIIVATMMYREISKSQIIPEVASTPITPKVEIKEEAPVEKVEEVKSEEVKIEESKEEVK